MIAAPTDLLRHLEAPRAPVDRLLAALGGEREPGIRRGGLPWRLIAANGVTELRLSPSEGAVDDAANRELIMACGAVVENLSIAANLEGRSLRVETFPESGGTMVARLALDASVSPRLEEAVLHRVIAGNARSGTPPEAGALSPALLALLRHGARSAGGRLDVVGDDERRALLAEFQARAERIADARRGAASPAPIPGHATPGAGGGIAEGGCDTLEELLAALGARFATRTPCRRGGVRHPRKDTIEAPLLAVLVTRGDAPGDWLSAGRALQRVLLHATAQGLYARLLNGALRESQVREAVRSILPAGGMPQAIVRLDVDADPARYACCDSEVAY